MAAKRTSVGTSTKWQPILQLIKGVQIADWSKTGSRTPRGQHHSYRYTWGEWGTNFSQGWWRPDNSQSCKPDQEPPVTQRWPPLESVEGPHILLWAITLVRHTKSIGQQSSAEGTASRRPEVTKGIQLRRTSHSQRTNHIGRTCWSRKDHCPWECSCRWQSCYPQMRSASW